MVKRKNSIALDKTKPIFIGIDVHKKSWSLCFIHQDVIIGRFRIEAKLETLKKLIDRYKGHEIMSVYEAGFSGFYLHTKLTEIGVKNIITPTNKIPVVVGDKVKTDRIDSKKLATFLSKGLLIGNYIPSKELIDLRQLLRTREQIKRKRIRVINQLKMLLMQHGIIFDGIVGIPKYLCEQILRLELPPMTTLSIRTHIYELEFFNATLKEYENIYKDGPVDEVLRKTYIFLLSVPGIGPLAATALTYEIGDWNRFPNEKAIAAFVGLTPCEFSSGEHNHKGPITGQGNQWLRSLLIEASWRLISKDPEMYSFYERLKIKKGSKKAIVAVARKLICRLYAMVKKEEVYKFKKAA